jgi:serine/threonine protein kinase
MGKRADWEEIKGIGGGGQSDVFLVRTPARTNDILNSIDRLKALSTSIQSDKAARNFAEAAWNCARPDLPSELGALKVFKIPPEGAGLSPPPGSKQFEAIERLKNEIAALSQGPPLHPSLAGLPRLLDFSERERWIVTEYFPERTLEHHPLRYKGRVAQALRAFRSLVQTVASLHREGYVHRDIKPANVFIRKDDELVLGDFGIVYVPSAPDKVTLTGERVGPRDYMPPWANLGVRHDNVHPRDDVYMLGKLLWSMVDGRAVLPREYYKHPDLDFDLTKTFPNDPNMYLINSILDACVVEQASQCLSGAQDLLVVVDTTLRIIERGGQLLKEGVLRPCHVCGNGSYKPEGVGGEKPDPTIVIELVRLKGIRNDRAGTIRIQPYVCDYCGHVAFFKTGNA